MDRQKMVDDIAARRAACERELRGLLKARRDKTTTERDTLMHWLRFRDAVTWLEMDIYALEDCDLQARMNAYEIGDLRTKQIR